MDFFTHIDPELIAKLQTGGYIVMFGLMFLEWPFVTIASAFLASLGFFNIYIVAFLWWAGDFIGDLFFFCIGKYGLKIFSKKTRIDTPDEVSFIKKLDTLIQKNLFLSVVISKITPYAPLFTFPYMGRSGVSLRKFMVASAVTSIPIPIGVAIIGYHMNALWRLIETASKTEIILAIISMLWWIVLIVWSIWYLWKRYQPLLREYLPETSPRKPSRRKK